MTPAGAGRIFGFAVAGLAALGLSGCSNGHALALVRQACTHVERSLTLYQASTMAPSPSEQQADSAAALAELRQALPLASSAAGENAQWQAFSITLSESSRVPESDLVAALRQQCTDVSNGGQGPATPATTLPPPATNPEPIGRS